MGVATTAPASCADVGAALRLHGCWSPAFDCVWVASHIGEMSWQRSSMVTSNGMRHRRSRAARGVHLSLKSLREAAGKTQVDVADESQMDQADISRLEARADFEDCLVATMRRYVEALGGSLEVVARFGDKRVVIAGAQRKVAAKPVKVSRAGRKPVRS
jgi:hypothetical protein